jgi:cell division protein FtsZ
MTLYEVDAAANRVREEVDSDANIIFGSTFDERLSGLIRVSVVATGIGGRDSAFKNNNAADMTKFGKKESNFKLLGLDIDDKEEQALETDIPSPNINNFANSTTETVQKRAHSFLGKFTSKHKKAEYDNHIDEERISQTDNPPEKPQQDDLDIPSCFRRKK